MSKPYDEKAFENEIASALLDRGYVEMPSDRFDAERGLFPQQIVSFVKETQPEAWEKLETAHKGNARQRFLQELTSAIERQGTLELLRHGLHTTGTKIDLATFQPNTGINPELQRKYDANVLGVTQQLHHSATNPDRSVDLALSLNGIPVATAELKNTFTDQTTQDAREQYKNRDPSEPVLRFKRGALVHFAIDQNEVYYTTELDGEDTNFLPFNKGHEKGGGNPPREDDHRTAYLWKEVWEKDSWMDIIQRFIHIDTEEIKKDGVIVEEDETLIFPRYHQLECVRQLVDSAKREGSGEDYLVQHSTGSGKSKSIAWLVHRLVSLHNDDDEAIFDGVVVVTDRTILDEQLRNTIYELDHKTGVVHGITGENGPKSEELAEALEAGKPVIITTLQTFPYVIEHTQSLPERDYAVVVDEAHSSQTGEMSAEMKGILSGVDEDEIEDAEDAIVASAEARSKQPNLSFFAFTATPKAKTLQMFGEPDGDGGYEPFHLYSMRQAIDEGFILDVLRNYTTYETFYNVAKVVEEDPQVPEKKAVKAISRFLKLHPHNVSQKVEIIVEHFRNNTRHKIGGKAKAMIVTSSRSHAVRYKKAIDEYIEENGYNLSALVAFSGTVEDDGQSYTEEGMNDGIKESELPNAFDSQAHQVLVVADKYQTGFDQPLLHTMYVDKKLSGIQAVQTLSRLNRTHPGKEDTFVLDFENEQSEIKEAFEPFYGKTTVTEETDPQHLQQLASEVKSFRIFDQNTVDQFAEVFFDPENTGTEGAHAKLSSLVQPARDRFIASDMETQEEFRSTLRSFLRLYKFQSQIVSYADTHLEKLYTFGRFLYKELPKGSGQPDVEFDDELALQYYRLEKSEEGEIDIDTTDGEVQGPTETGTGGGGNDDEVELSTIVEKINDKLGTDFTEADQLFLEQLKEDALEDDHLRRSARVNSRENFALEFDSALTDMFIDRMDQNEELFAEFMDNDEVQEVITEHLRQQVYQESQQAEG
ncbi:type I restriction endonuclease subunit R [Halorubrum ezzemoulense]|jgi:type I restriction enzyme R subunit|uniref:type I restriction endonuclease subunit R n=1 Tax=Halorubrum ezzemoulense TaxID=337243 RepID=UPI00232B5F0F|nr:DEAD/DEAH box helicase family protein [Halorubrum ezzemoulense]MDB2239878.1 DEAD/DEAH box helicase family protein [Halorubrum ezzemoulense]